jgi:hypothetical protein
VVSDATGPDGRARRRARNVARCNACGTVVESMHPWDTVTCACGALTVSGGPERPWRSWNVVSGAGWTDLATDEDDRPQGGDAASRDDDEPGGDDDPGGDGEAGTDAGTGQAH